jgi:hypothetical protein
VEVAVLVVLNPGVRLVLAYPRVAGLMEVSMVVTVVLL